MTHLHTAHLKAKMLFALMLLSFWGFSQNVPITFETGGNGATWTWTTFENGTTSAPMQILANPVSGGINTSATVAKLTPLIVGQPWAGVESFHGAGIGTWTITASNSTIKIMVYKTVISDVGIKLVTSTGGSTGEIKKPNTVINQWEEITFDFSSKIGETNDQIVVFPDFQARTTDNVCYWDNISFSGTTPPPSPATAAPTPTKPAADVISMFSNAYTNVAVDTWRTSWSAATLTDLQIVGNDTKKYSSLDFVGIETVGANMINASAMLYFHVDAWTSNMTTFRIKLVDFGADAAYGGGDDKEQELSFTPTLNSWNGFEIPMTDFTGLTTKGHIAQLIFSGAPAGSGIVYIDNVYFHKVPFVDPNIPTIAAPTPTWPAADVISMFSNAYTNKTVDTWRTSWSAATLTDLQIAGNDTKKYSSLDFVGIETTGANQINATPMKWLHLDAWTPNMTTFKVKLVDFGADAAFGGGDDKEHELTLTAPTLKAWNSYDLLLSDFTGLTTRAHLAQYILVGVPTGTSTVYLDNVYFRKSSIGINTTEEGATKIYPNPATTSLTIEASQSITRVSLFNVLGQEVLTSMPNASSLTLDIASLPKGIYVVQSIIDGNVSTSKLIKE
ncbi:MAG: T9SS type A sorting domain-containing protein [Bacteroidetes bacterium]|nr:T9SS type A sorting domain-containing protein [Bacteroidota bacterium]